MEATDGVTKKSRIGSLSEMKMEILWWMNPIRTGGRIKRTLTVMESESPYLMKMESRKSGQGTANSGNVY